MSYKELVAAFAVVMVIGLGCSKKKANVDVVESNIEPIEIIEARLESDKKIDKIIEDRQKVPESFAPENLHFEFDNYRLSKESLKSLAKIAKEMNQKLYINVSIAGYCCPIGSYEYNMALGQHRAYEAQKYLVNYGINPVRIICTTYGEENLITKNPEDYWLNRRDEFKYEILD